MYSVYMKLHMCTCVHTYMCTHVCNVNCLYLSKFLCCTKHRKKSESAESTSNSLGKLNGALFPTRRKKLERNISLKEMDAEISGGPQ